LIKNNAEALPSKKILPAFLILITYYYRSAGSTKINLNRNNNRFKNSTSNETQGFKIASFSKDLKAMIIEIEQENPMTKLA